MSLEDNSSRLGVLAYRRVRRDRQADRTTRAAARRPAGGLPTHLTENRG